MPLGKKIKMYYDPRGQVIETVNPDDSLQTVFFGEVSDLDNPQNYTPSPWVSFSYDANDNGDRRSGGKGLTPASNINTPKSAEIDAMGRTIKTTEHDAHYNGSSYVDVVMEYSYDIRGNQLTVTDPNNRNAFTYKYDYANRNLWTYHIDSGESTINMDVMGNPIEAINAKGGETLSSYDILNRPIRLWAKDDSTASFTLRQYPIYGDDLTATGKTAQQTKDLNLYGKGWKLYDEAGLVFTEDYDFKGNLLEKTRQVIKDSELLSVFTPPPTNWQVNPYIVDWTGLPTTILDTTTMVTTMTYDALNRAMNVMYPNDVNGNRKILTPTYNKAGTVLSVDYDGTEYIKEIAYDAKGQPLLTAYGNDIMTRYAYDQDTFRVERLKSEKYVYSNLANNPTYVPQSGSTKQDFAYEYDLVGNIMKLHDRTPDCGILGSIGGVDALDKLFDYDPLYRVISASGRESTNQNPNILWGTVAAAGSPNANNAQAYTQSFQYDKLGNMEKLQQIGNNAYTRNYKYDNYATDNKLSRIEGTGSPAPVYSNFSYDVNGNMTTSATDRTYIWDAADQLRAFSIQAGTSEPSIYAQYLYSGGQRIKKIVRTTGGDYEVTVYDGGFEYMKKVSGGTTYEKNYTHIEGAATVRTGNGTNFPGDITDDIVYNLGDNIGSINVRLSTTGTLIDREEYYPFGDTSLRTYIYKRYRYVNKQKDAESGLYYYGARYYASWTCRFISIDPLADQYAHLTPYNYAGNKPVNSIDIDGMQGENEPNSITNDKVGGTPITFENSDSLSTFDWQFGTNNIPELKTSSGGTQGQDTIQPKTVQADTVRKKKKKTKPKKTTKKKVDQVKKKEKKDLKDLDPDELKELIKLSSVASTKAKDDLDVFLDWFGFGEGEGENQTKTSDKKKTIDLSNEITFYPYRSSDKLGCFRRCEDMIGTMGFQKIGPRDSRVIQMTKNNSNGKLTPQEGRDKGVTLIDEQLEASKPIIVGVDYKKGHPGNDDKTTDHWIIIVGRGYDSEGLFYHFFDPQTSSKDHGTSKNNKLRLQSNNTLQTTYTTLGGEKRNYTVTMIRPVIKK